MTTQLSALVTLAASMHAQPGVYALLLGSGVSTGAGIPTGWGVVRDLVGRLAGASDRDNGLAAESARQDPEAWWAEPGSGELGYSTLLEQLAPLPASRQGLLAGFFEPNDEEREAGIKAPSKAHMAIAELVKLGFVRVIVTTNFDRLMERALEAVGISPQVIARPEAVNGMAPLAHSAATVIKLHGDYKDLGSRNTPGELSDYPDEWQRLLTQVFDEYGLIVAGWSADWDEALVASLESAPNRRYPLYWDSRSSSGENAKRLLANRAGTVIPASGADELFSELSASVEALEQLGSPRLTVAMGVARLKRYLPDPVRRIDLHDLVMEATREVASGIRSSPLNPPGGIKLDQLEQIYASYFQSMDLLAPLLINGVWHDQDGVHDSLWVDVVQELLDEGTAQPQSAFNRAAEKARRFPGFIAMGVIGITVLRRGRDDLFVRLSTEAETWDLFDTREKLPAAQILHYLELADPEWVQEFPRWEATRWHYPVSHLFGVDLRRYFRGSMLRDDEFVESFQTFEYRLGLIQEQLPGRHAIAGEYAGELGWVDEVPKSEMLFRKQIDRNQRVRNAWSAFFGGTKELEEAVLAQRDVLKRYVRY